ncbi:MAG: peptidoglycan bridge formation glycyltransferase FemA/FemB family protein [Candidatus Atribacteria bacterium]|nr:peptidoglycan bridge formation glycyltransferase FemA/FemB family protein [Candidatus Atribacteria bacterium]
MRAAPIEIDWNPGLSIYASEGFLKSVGDEYGWLGAMDDSEELRCILPYTIVRKAMVRMVRFRVETILLDEGFGVEEEKSFLDSAVEYFRSIGVDIIIPATTNAIFRTYPAGAVAAPYGTLIIDLDRDEETLFNNLSSSHRRKIRLAAKAGVKILSGFEHAEIAYALVRDTFRRSSMPFMDYAAFQRMVGGLGENIKIMVAEYRGVIQGCVVIPFSGHSAYYVYGGSITDPETGSMNLLHWEAIRLFQSLGVKRYDFCGVRIDPEKGSKQEGLMAFKERFGPRLVQGFMWKYSLKPLKSRIYSLAIRLLRGGDIVDAERHKLKASRNLP